MRPLRQYLPEHRSAGAVPGRCAVGNLVWTHGGSVWAIWRVAPVPYKYLSHGGKLAFHENVRQAILALGAEAMLLSVCPPLDQVGAGMALLKGHENRETWTLEAARAVDTLAAWAPFERWFYVAAKLGSAAGVKGEIREQLTSIARRPFTRPTDRDVRASMVKAGKIEAELRRCLTVTRPSASEARWIYARALRRGIRDLGLGTAQAPVVDAPGFHAIGEVVTTEGGGDGRGILRPYLKVVEPSKDGESVGYQTHIVMADFPVSDFPGDTEMLWALDGIGYPVDWAIQMHSVSNAESRRLLAKKSKALVNELGGDGQAREIERTGHIPPSLQEAWDALLAHRERLMALKSEGNVRATIAMTTWAPDRVTAEARADAVVEALSPYEWGLTRPLGGQSGLLEMSMPGARTTVVGLNYEQTLLPTDLAALAPFAGSDIGDDHGFLLGARMDCKTNRPVYWDPEGRLASGGSASVGFCGTLGTGKSLSAKRSLHAVLARGGRGVAVDRTPSGEWVRFAHEMKRQGFTTSVVTTDPDSHGSFDTFRIFADEKDQRRYSTGFCLLVTQAQSNSLQGICITDAVEVVAGRPQEERSLAAVLDVLEEMYTVGRRGAEEAFLTLRSFAHGSYGRMAFDKDVPAADLTADLVVFHVPDLELPDRETMRDRAANLLPEQLGALGAFYLIAAAGRVIILAEPTRLAVFVADEAWALTSSVQGAALLENTGRDGRKRYAALWLLFQHPDDVSDPKLLALLTTRFVYAQGKGAGAAALKFLGAEVTPELIAKVEDGLSRKDDPEGPPEPARCLMLDAQERIGEVVWMPPSPALARAMETNPLRLAAYGEDDEPLEDSPPEPVPAETNGHGQPAELGDYEVAQ